MKLETKGEKIYIKLTGEENIKLIELVIKLMEEAEYVDVIDYGGEIFIELIQKNESNKNYFMKKKKNKKV